MNVREDLDARKAFYTYPGCREFDASFGDRMFQLSREKDDIEFYRLADEWTEYYSYAKLTEELKERNEKMGL